MFVCEECIKKEGIFAIAFSFGSCEKCKKSGLCADIDYSKLKDFREENKNDN